MKQWNFLSSVCLAVAVMFVMSVSVHPAMAYDAIDKQIACATCGEGLGDILSIPGLENNPVAVNIREVPADPLVSASAGPGAGKAPAASGAQIQNLKPGISYAINNPRDSIRPTSLVMATAGGGARSGSPEIMEPKLAGFIANMSSEGYDFTGESKARYESTVKSNDFLSLNSSQKQALTSGGFTLVSEDTVISHRDATYYEFTNRTTQTQIYILAVQRIDAGGNPVGDREFSLSPEINSDGSAVKTSNVQAVYGATPSNGKSCWWQWLYFIVACLGLLIFIILLILALAFPVTYGTIFPVAMTATLFLEGTTGGAATSHEYSSAAFRTFQAEKFGATTYYNDGSYGFSQYVSAHSQFTEVSNEATWNYVFSKAAVAGYVTVGLAVLVNLLFALYQLGLCKGWWGKVWSNHDWDHTAGDFVLADNGKPQTLYKADRILVSLYADTSADKNAGWKIVSKGSLGVSQEGSLLAENGKYQCWIIEAPVLGTQDLTFEYKTTKSVPSSMETTRYSLPVTVKETPFVITTVDSARDSGGAGNYNSLAIDKTGTPYISYYDAAKKVVKYATPDNGAWGIKIVADSAGTRSTSIALDPAGNPAISFGDGLYLGNMMYAQLNGTSWSVEKVDNGGKTGNVGQWSSLVFDQDGVAHLTYNGGSSTNANPRLWYAVKNGNTWEITNVDSSADVASTLVLDQSGRAMIAYTSGEYGTLMFAAQDRSGNWKAIKVDTGGHWYVDTGYEPSIAVDPSGNVHISYSDITNRELKYASWDGVAWNIETVAATLKCQSSLAIDANGQPFVSYYDQSDKSLHWATRSPGSSSWSVHVVDTNGAGEYSSIALDPSGHPNIAYFDGKTHSLKYAAWKN